MRLSRDQRQRRVTSTLIVILSIAIFVLDLSTPLGWADWLLYLIPLLLVSPLLQAKTLVVLASSYTVLTSVGVLLSPARGSSESLAILNRGVGLVALWSATFLLASRKRLEDQLGLQNVALASAANSVVITDADGAITWVNAAFTQLTGYANEEVVGHTPRLLRSGMQDQTLYERLWVTIRSGQVWSGEMINRRKDGTLFIGELMIAPVVQRGTVTHFIGIQQDISARRREEEARRASELSYRRLFESAHDGILILDAVTGMIVDVNPFLIDLLGFSGELFLGRKVWELGAFKEVVANESRFKELQALGYVRYEDKLLVGADGRLIDVEFVSNVYLVDHQKVMQCNIRDIRVRKQLEAAHAHMAAIVDSADETIVSTTLDGIVTSWNRAAERLYGYSAAEVIGRNLSVLMPPEDAPKARQTMEALARGDSIDQDEAVRVCKDGRRIPIQLTVSAIRNGSGAVVGGSFIAHDISAQKQAKAETKRLISELEQANHVKADFLATMSHELRTPLNIVIGYNDLLLEGQFGSLAPEQAATVRRTQRSAEELLSLIATMLDISRVDSWGVSVQVCDTDLRALLREIAAEASGVGTPSVPVTWEVPPEVPRLYTDPAKLKVVIKNLYANAAKFTERGHVTVRAGTSDGGVEIVVTDTGIGIAPDILPVIFEPFRQGDGSSTRRYGGSGLGLYIVRRYLDVLGGTIRVDSELGRGSTFRVWLPVGSPRPLAAEERP
jgi:PAS domain S-box-containing protein